MNPDQLFEEINRFKDWAKNYPKSNKEEHLYFDSEWECNYKNWDAIYTSFQNFIAHTNPLEWSEEETTRLLYIVARDNEDERLVDIIAENEAALTILAQQSLLSGEKDSKWQLATRLHLLKDKNLAASLLHQYAQDQDEYVRRRASTELENLKTC